ncbi:MAG: hypothetical protein EBQ78_06665 [Betaproteobacteria bacterium]|jgi:hypothetical protein|nr:hypothetical protein [Betaproteobacteria bacterium]NBY17287.1 hypothetical protein [Betaproteobacteria bacterium]
MKICKTAQLTLAAGLLSLLTACGGDSSTTPTTTSTAPTTEQVAAFTSGYNSGVAGLKSFSGLTSSGFVDLFDDAFLDAGYTKQALKDNLTQESFAVAVAADLSSFPVAALSGVTVAGCDANGVCTLTATVTNTDVDTTTTTYTIPVKFSSGKVRLYGDQKAA